MGTPDREIAQRELRNEVSEVLREVASGHVLRVTVRGRPVADLVPVTETRRFVGRSELASIIEEAPLDPGFAEDVHAALSSSVADL